MKSPRKRAINRSSAHLLTCSLAALLLAAGPAHAASLLYQWDFNSPSGDNTTVAPAIGSGGVLTMSQGSVDPSTFDFVGPTATNLYSAAGTGVFGTSNQSDRAFNNSGTTWDLENSGGSGDYAGMASSNNTGIAAPNNTLSATAGSHAQITVTSWVKLDSGALAAHSNPVLVAIGQSGYDGGTGSGISGTYLGFWNNSGFNGQVNTLQFSSNGAAGADAVNNNGYVGGNNIINPFKNDWMFVAVTYDSAASPSGSVKFYLGDKGDPLGPAVSSGTLPTDSTTPATAGPADLNAANVYIGNNIGATGGRMSRGLGALIDDVRIYDGVLTQSQLDLVRQNLVIAPGKGDFDFNGVTNAGDIGAMMTALCDVAGYQASHGNMSMPDLVTLGDFDDSGNVDNLDLQGFINFLANAPAPGAGSLSAVPEPSAWILLLLGGLAVVFAGNQRAVR